MVDSIWTPRSSRSRILRVKSQPLLSSSPIGLLAGDEIVVRKELVESLATLKENPSWMVSTGLPPSVAIQSNTLKRLVPRAVRRTDQSTTADERRTAAV